MHSLTAEPGSEAQDQATWPARRLGSNEAVEQHTTHLRKDGEGRYGSSLSAAASAAAAAMYAAVAAAAPDGGAVGVDDCLLLVLILDR